VSAFLSLDTRNLLERVEGDNGHLYDKYYNNGRIWQDPELLRAQKARAKVYKSFVTTTNKQNSEGHLLFEQLSLSPGDFNFIAGVEPNPKSTVGRWLNALDIP
jgi:hypothetical protein